MQFIVRGKSVDFKNREGSSPSIPKKPIRFLIILSFFFVSSSKLVILLIHPTLLQMDPRKNLSLMTSLVIYDTCTNGRL